VSLAHAIERAETLHDITFSHDGMAKDGKWRIMSVADYEAEAGDFDDWFKGRQEKASALVREALAEAEKSWKSLEHPMRDDPAAEESDFSERDCGCCHGRKRMFPDDDEDSCPHCHGKGWSKDEYFPTVQGLLSLQRQEWRKAGQPLD
jgi:DnaJ-class molecular chaperone